MNEIWQDVAGVLQFLIFLAWFCVMPGLPIYLWLNRRRFDENRIDKAINARGWVVVSTHRAWNLGDLFINRQGRRYAVAYRTHTGELVEAECITGFLMGNRWVSSIPFSGTSVGNGLPQLRSSKGYAPPVFAPRYRG